MRYMLTTKLFSEDPITSRHETKAGLDEAMANATRGTRNHFEPPQMIPGDGSHPAMATGVWSDQNGCAIGMYSVRAEVDYADIA